MILFILNDSPYGSQRTHNSLRLASTLARKNAGVRIFLLGDGVVAGVERQSPTDASYNAQETLRMLAANGVAVTACTTCLQARGISEQALVSGVRPSNMDELADLVGEAEKVLVF